MIMIVKTLGSLMGSPAAAEEGGETMGGGRGKSGQSKVRAKTVYNVCGSTEKSR